MSNLRRAVAEVRFGPPSVVTMAGSRTVHQYWNLLSSHFREILLMPHRRSDGGGVSWTWHEEVENKPLAAAEFAKVRKRLTEMHRVFAEHLEDERESDPAPSGVKTQDVLSQIGVSMRSITNQLTAKSDADLARYVCRTETGIMIHSWGVSPPAVPIYPDVLEYEISGSVMVAGKPSGGHKIILENASGLCVAQMQVDGTGAFRFPKLGAGRFNVRAVCDHIAFPAEGVAAVIERSSVTGLVISDLSSGQKEDPVDDIAKPSVVRNG